MSSTEIKFKLYFEYNVTTKDERKKLKVKK